MSCLQLCLWWNYRLHLRNCIVFCASTLSSQNLWRLNDCVYIWSFFCFIRNLYGFNTDTRWAILGVKSSKWKNLNGTHKKDGFHPLDLVCMSQSLFARHILHSATIESIKLKQTSTMHKFHRHIDTQRSRKWLSFFVFNEVQVVENILTFEKWRFP